MMKEQLYCEVKPDGTISNEKTFWEIIRQFAGQRIIITVEKKRKKRSIRQNNYYFGCICDFFKTGALEQWGEHLDTEQAHEELKKHCNFKEVVNIQTGEMIGKISLSTKDLTTLEFEEYEERCRKLIYTFFGIIVTLPNKQTQAEFINKKH